MNTQWEPTGRTIPPAVLGVDDLEPVGPARVPRPTRFAETTGLDDQPAEDTPLEVSRLEFDVIWESLDLGELPLVLKVASPGKTTTERRQLVETAWHAMEGRGLGRGSPDHRRLSGLLRLLARPEREIDGRLWFGRRVGSLRVLVAATGTEAVHAALNSTGLRLRAAAATGLAREALSTLPPLTAGSGESVTVPSRRLEAAAASASTPAEFETALRREGVRARDAATLASMMMRIRRHAQFGAASRDRFGHRGRATRVLSVFDTREGRYLQLRTATEPDAEPWTTVSPADSRLLLRELDELSQMDTGR